MSRILPACLCFALLSARDHGSQAASTAPAAKPAPAAVPAPEAPVDVEADVAAFLTPTITTASRCISIAQGRDRRDNGAMRRAQLILTVPALVTLIVPAVMDLNHSHQLNEAWPPHARYHGAVLLSANVLAGLISLWLLWGARGGDAVSRLRTAALLPALLWGSFFPALLAPGVSTWPDGTDRLEALPFAPNVIIGGLMVVLCIAGARLASRAPGA